MRLAGIGLLLAISLWCPSTSQADSFGLLVYPSEGQPVDVGELEALAEAVLGEQGDLVVDAFREASEALLLGEVARTQETKSRAELFTQIDRDRREAWRNYIEGRTSFAAKRFSELRDDAVVLAGLEDGYGAIAELSLRLGVTRVELNLLAEASDDFRLAHALAPARVVDDNEFKPEVVLAYQTAVAAEEKTQERFVQVSPAKAEVFIDGELAEAGSRAFTDGLHILAVRAPGYKTHTRILSVAVGRDAPIVIELSEDPLPTLVLRGPEAISLGAMQGTAERYLGGVVRYSSAQGVLLLSSVWRQEQPAILGQLCKGSTARCSPVVEIGYLEGGQSKAMAELYRRLIVAPRRLSPSLQSDFRVLASPGRPARVVQRPAPWWKNKWVWLGVAGASLTASAAYIWRGQDTITPVFSGSTCDFGGCE